MTDVSIRIHMFLTSVKETLVSSLHRDEQGQDLIEYALLGGLIATAMIALIGFAAYQGGLTAMADGIASCIDYTDGGCDPF